MYSLFCHLKGTCTCDNISIVLEVRDLVCMRLPLIERLSGISVLGDSRLAIIISNRPILVY